MNTLTFYGGVGEIFQARYVSGYLSQPELIELVELLQPRKIIPIHTSHPQLFKDLFGEKGVLAENEVPINIE